VQGIIGDLVASVLELPGAFGAVAANDPLSAVLLVVGLVFLGLSSGTIGYLALGAVVDLVTPT
jgi:hypothetical protein